MNRPVEWAEPAWEKLVESLPEVIARPIKNGKGDEHEFEADTILNWPQRGIFSTRERREWNGMSIGSGRRRPAPIQPKATAEALRRTLEANHVPGPEWWETGLTGLGEWWTLRACWRWPNRKPDTNKGEVIRFIAIEHDVRWSVLTIAGGLRRSDGATIGAAYEGAKLTGPLITGRLPKSALTHAVSQRIDQAATMLSDWREQPVTAGALSSWTGELLDQSWGPETAPRLLLRNGISPRRSRPEILANTPERIVSDDLNQIAWQLGLSALCVTDVIDRAELTARITSTVQELASYQAGMQVSEAPETSTESGGTGQIH